MSTAHLPLQEGDKPTPPLSRQARLTPTPRFPLQEVPSSCFLARSGSGKIHASPPTPGKDQAHTSYPTPGGGQTHGFYPALEGDEVHTFHPAPGATATYPSPLQPTPPLPLQEGDKLKLTRQLQDEVKPTGSSLIQERVKLVTPLRCRRGQVHIYPSTPRRR